MEMFKDRRGNKMADKVKSLRQAQLSKQASKFGPILRAYRDKKMKEHGVDLQNEQAMRAERAMQEIFAVQLEAISHFCEEYLAALKVYHQAKERGDNEAAERADSILDAIHYKLNDEEDDLKMDAYVEEKLEEYGIDFRDEQAKKAIQAMTEILEKRQEM